MLPIGSVIQTKRKALGMSQADFAKDVELSQATVSKIENGRISPTAHQLIQFASVLQMPPHDFFVRDPYQSSTDWFGIETLRQLRQLSVQEEYEEMLSIIHNVLNAPFFKTRRNRAELLYWKACCTANTGMPETAIDLCTKFLDDNPNYPDTALIIRYKIVLGNAYRIWGDYTLSKQHLEDALYLLNGRPEIIDIDLHKELLYSLGHTYYHCGLTQLAMEVCLRLKSFQDEERMVRFKQTGSTLTMMGDISRQQGMLDSALQFYRQALFDYETISNTSGQNQVRAKLNALIRQLERHSETEPWDELVAD